MAEQIALGIILAVIGLMLLRFVFDVFVLAAVWGLAKWAKEVPDGRTRLLQAGVAVLVAIYFVTGGDARWQHRHPPHRGAILQADADTAAPRP